MRRSRIIRTFAAAFALWLASLCAGPLPGAQAEAASLPPSRRIVVNLGETPWKYLRGQDPANAQAPGFDDSGWPSVGIPHSAGQLTTFLNMESGGGEGEIGGGVNWYRKRFALDAAYADRKVFVEFEGAHTGAQVYINGTFVPGNSALNPQATHVVGFVPFIVDITPHVQFGGGENLLAVRVAKNAAWFEDPGFSGAFRFGQGDTGLFRPVRMYLTDRVHIPRNTYAGLGTWGTYVSTLAAGEAAASINVQTNVLNEGEAARSVTLAVQIVDAQGHVVAAQQRTRSVPASAQREPVLFDQTLTVENPRLWFPNNSVHGGPYLYRVLHVLSIDGAVVDAVQTPLGIRTIAWDSDLPYINGQPHRLWGGSGRYDYPGLGSSVPEEQEWRDLAMLAAAGGNLYRPGHSSSSEAFVHAADALGVMIVQPSGDGENGFAAHCNAPPCARQVLKAELHRDMIVRDRSHPSILAWEANNGVMDTAFAQELKAISLQWDPIQRRVQADRTPDPANGDILGCTLQGCEVGVKHQFPDNPAWGAEYWGTGALRYDYEHEIAFAAPFLDDWRKSVEANAFGMVQWYFADTPGESGMLVDGTPNARVRNLNDSMVDINRFPRLLYHIYRAAWRPYALEPVVALAHHWNRAGSVRVNAFSNCPSVRLSNNGVVQGTDQAPNPWNSDPLGDHSQSTTRLPFQVHWDVPWQAGTLRADCLDAFGNVVASDEKRTAGPAQRVELRVVPNVVRPDGSSFLVTANGSDAAFVEARIVDANGVTVPTADNDITFAVSGPATYMGGSQSLVTPGQPIGYHAPGDPELAAEGGLQKIALRSRFTPGTVTVTATSPGLAAGTATLTIHPVQDTAPVATEPAIIVQPEDAAVTAGQPARFSVTASGAAPLSFQWRRNGIDIPGATAASYDTPATALGQDGDSFQATVANAYGTAVSASARLSVFAPAAPQIVQQPEPVTAFVGQTAHFAVAASGSPALAYQWRRNGVAIDGANEPDYTTPVLTSPAEGASFDVVVGNPVGSVVSAAAALVVNPAIAPLIVTPPFDVEALPGAPASFSVAVEGSAPLHYQWRRDGNVVGTDAPVLNIAAVRASDVGEYTVTVSNVAGSVTSAPAQLRLAPPDFNLALGKPATASSFENAETMPAAAATDGDPATRWASAAVDPSWIDVDLGAPMAFNRIILRWEAAYASRYRIEASDDGEHYATVVERNGAGGVEDFSFPAVRARHVRMLGLERPGGFGHSLFEFEVYDAASCGGANERYTVIDTGHVADNLSGLVWKRSEYTLPGQGAQFTQPLAAQYCAGLGMRLPTLDEALAVGGDSAATCAFPSGWHTWTSSFDLADPTYAWWAASSGDHQLGVANNFPGWALCTEGPAAQPPTIVAPPVDATVSAGAAAQFWVSASGAAPLRYLWLKNGAPVALNGTPAHTTPVATFDDDGALYRVRVTGGNGLSTLSEPAVLHVTGDPIPPPLITTQPVAQNVAAGTRAQFQAAASGALPLAFQWRRNGYPVPGATGANYLTPPLSILDHGSVFSVVVGNGGGSVASDGAVLSVTMPGRPNLALGRPATSGGDENAGLGPGNAVDGALGTRWSSVFEDEAWIAIDLGAPMLVDEVVLRWQAAYGTAYRIETSLDGHTWHTAYSRTGGTGGSEALAFPAVSARHIRLWGLARSSEFGYSLFEFEVYGPASTDPLFGDGFEE